jgi:hypothetical protein
MTSQDLLGASRRGGEKYRIDEVVIQTSEKSLTAVGTLGVTKDKFILDVILAPGASATPWPKGFTGRSGFWRITGVINHQRRFVAHDLPRGSSVNFTEEPRTTLTFKTNMLELEPTGRDAMTDQEFTAWIRKAERRAGGSGGDPDVTGTTPAEEQMSMAASDNAKVAVSFKALLPEFNLIFHDSETRITETNPFLGESLRSQGDTCHGEVTGWKFGLIQRDRDLEVHFRSTDEHVSQGPEHDDTLFRAFLDALAFTHGQHAWPCLFEHRRDGKIVSDRVHLGAETGRSSHAPFNEHVFFYAAAGKSQWKLQTCLGKAFDFLAHDSPLRDEITLLLYLMREASAPGVPHAITLLGVCTLFESLVHAIYDQQIAPVKATDTKAFEEAKVQICRELGEKAASLGDRTQYDRICAIVKSAAPVYRSTKFQEVARRLGLQPAEHWNEIYTLWSKSRNPLSHRITGNEESEESFKDHAIAESRIAGAINRMVLKVMGYSGHV